MQAKDIQNEQGLSDELQAQGVFVVEVLRDGKNGPEVMQRRTIPNLVVNAGKRQIWRKATGLSTNLWKFMRIGTSGVSANSGQTNLVTPVTGTLRTVSDFTLLSGTRTFQWVVSYQSGAGTKSATNIREVVVMNSHTSPGGSALSRSTFTAVNKTTADKLRITYRARVT
jgi:hypothetical protein